MFGGETSNPTTYIPGEEGTPMDQITLYDPGSKFWYQQTAAGSSIPSARSRFCTVGVHDRRTLPNSYTGSYEM